MEDFERYGDYNEIDEPPVKKKNVVLIILKLITALCCLGVVGILGFRMIIFNSYPESIKSIYFNDVLAEYYEQTDGNIGAKTQKLRAKYDDPDKGQFFCDNLIIIEGADQLQISVRYNASNLEDIRRSLKLDYELDSMDPDIFSFRLYDNYDNVYENVTLASFESKLMYRYQKLVFDGVELAENDEEEYPEWIRLEIFVKGQTESEPYAMVAIYENNEEFNTFTDYELSSVERPQ